MAPAAKRILIIDDHADSAEIMKIWLERWNYHVALAATATEGLQLAQSESFELCLLNTRLPEMSGFELCEHICRLPGKRAVVFVSGAAFESDKQRGFQAGAIAYLTKPLDFGTLKITLDRLVTGKRESDREGS